MSTKGLRVLHVIPSMGYGGAERQAAYLAHGLGALGIEVHYALFTGGENLTRLQDSGARVHRLREAPNRDPRRLFELARLADRVAPDLIQTWLPMANVLGGLVSRRAGVPWVYAERTVPDAYARSLTLDLDRWLACRYAAAVVSNSHAADAMWERRLPAGRLRAVIRNALPVPELDRQPPASPEALGLPGELPLVLYVGRLAPDKGIDALLGALERVNAKRPLCGLLIGAGELVEPIREQLRAPCFAGRVLAPGFRYDVAAWLKRAAVFVSLSRYEGMPNTVMEAMATRCPLVVSDIPSHRELLDEGSAHLVPLDDVGAVADAIEAVLARPDEAAGRAARARARAEAWSLEAASRAWSELYGRVTS